MKRVLAVVLFLVLAACGQKEAPAPGAPKAFLPVEPAQAVEAPAGKIEVVEFFSYACIHCYKLHPLAKSWAAAQPADVVFRRVPVTFDRPPMVPLAKLFYTLEAAGLLDAHDDAVFAAIHDQGQSLMTEEAVLAWATARGIDMTAFRKVWDAPETMARVTRGADLARAYKVGGTPALYAGGRWQVNLDAATGYDHLMQLTGQLVGKIRRGEQP
jgi:protein dithiol oxidoreductase (disulfide-forming)